MTADVDMELVNTLDAFMLASAILTISFHDNISIDDMLKTIQNVPTSALPADSPCKVLKTSTKMTIGNTTLERRDLCTLYPDKWLNDQVIHAYLGILKSDFNSVHHKGCYVLPCFLATKWEAGECNAWLYPKVPLETYQTVLLPVCHQHHWFLLVASMETATISVLDSLPYAGRTQRFSNHWRHFMSARGDKRTWQTGEVTSNKQTDGNSCGVFVLMNAEAIMEATTPLIMRQCHVGFFRKYALKKLLQSPSGAKKNIL
ncbi:Sentrin-specific protease 2 [Mizuhopecten yessoensis]|uniref:Sentrin-specific protease 2 n=2 Tax=Mizuhopecten yessoensis TaxID=6573 RepID=A0A210QU50_MIZYE|nr:Sentrin-specific protease 2 [Mizuhopecten yessoensis]